jgi:CheY-like chemotaxis protein
MPDNKRNAPSHTTTLETEMLAGYRIHCIENDASILAGLTAVLRSWGCQIVDAAQNPDVVIADFHLDNGITGLDRYSELCSKLDYTIPAVIITADRSPAIQNEVRAHNCILLYKPIKPAALRATLGQLRLLSADTSWDISPEGSLTVT